MRKKKGRRGRNKARRREKRKEKELRYMDTLEDEYLIAGDQLK